MALYRQLKFPSTFIEYRSLSEWKGVVVISNFDSLKPPLQIYCPRQLPSLPRPKYAPACGCATPVVLEVLQMDSLRCCQDITFCRPLLSSCCICSRGRTGLPQTYVYCFKCSALCNPAMWINLLALHNSSPKFPLQKQYTKFVSAYYSFVNVLGIWTSPQQCSTTATSRDRVQHFLVAPPGVT